MTTRNLQSDSVTEAMDGDRSGFDPAWASDAPLKLVAWALTSLPESTGRKKDILDVLSTQVELSPSPDSWWNRVRRKLRESDHFEERKSNQFTVLHEVEDISHEPLRAVRNSAKAKTTKNDRTRKEKQPPKLEREWTAWFQGEAEGPPPTRGRTKEAISSLDKCDTRMLRKALRRMTQCSDVSRSTKKAAGVWANLMSHGASRLRDSVELDGDADLPESIGQTLAWLVEAANFPHDSGHWLRRAGGLPDGVPETWRSRFAIGVWKGVDASRHGPRDWFRQAFQRTVAEDRAAITREIAFAAFTTPSSFTHSTQLDRLLDTLLPVGGENEFLEELIVRSASGKAQKQSVLNYIDHKSKSISESNEAERLKMLVLASLLLTDGQDPINERTSQQIAEVLSGSSEYLDGSIWAELLSGSRQHIGDLREQHASELKKQRLDSESKLGELRKEEGRLNETVQHLRAEIVEGREVARMDVLQDILTVITETLQSLRYREGSPEQTLRRVEANLTLALRAGGGEEFGTVDDIVPYDPLRHLVEQYVPIGTPVRIAFPGAVIPGKVAGDRVLLKAGVVGPVEVN